MAIRGIERLSNIPNPADPLIEDVDDGWEDRANQEDEITDKIRKFQAEINTLIEKLDEKCN